MQYPLEKSVSNCYSGYMSTGIEAFRHRIESLRKAHNISARALSLRIGQNAAYIQQLESGMRNSKLPGYPVLKAIADVFGMTVEELLEPTSSQDSEVPEIQTVPLAELLERIGAHPVAGEFVEGLKLSAGQGSFLIQDFDEARPRKRRSAKHPERIQVIEVEGHCMERVLYPGDKVLVDTQRMPTIGEVTAAVRFHHDSIVKFLREKEGDQYFEGIDGTIVPLDQYTRIIGPVVDVQRSIWRMIEEAR
jgi:transcriptional regulator with XRE-family HTH domain